MFSEIKAIGELFITLISAHEKNREKLIKETIEPLVSNAEAVMNAYRNMARKAGSAKATDKKKVLDSVLRELVAIRDSYLFVRHRISAVSSVAKDKWSDPELKQFASTIYNCIGCMDCIPLVDDNSSVGYVIIRQLERYQRRELDSQQLQETLDMVLKATERNWACIMNAYAPLKISTS